MRLSALLFLFCAISAVTLATRPGLADAAWLAGFAACAALVLVFRARPLRARPAGRRHDPRQIVVDGSNVLYWKDNAPDIRTLASVVDHLERLGYHPRVVFDANAGYLVAGSYTHDAAFAWMLSLPRDRVQVVPKGRVADEFILAAARDMGLRVVSNDRYRDWLDKHPEIRAPGRLVRGGWRDGRPWVDVDAFSATRHAA
jgi:hypothetical protein